MTLLSESLRILVKDLRVQRWPLAGWIGLLVITVARGLDLMPALHGALFPVALIVPVMAAILVALAVLADPAQDGPTFWGVHRQRPVAMAAAKAGLALLLLMLMEAGHAVVLASHDLTGSQVSAIVAESAATTGAWLLFAAALAACARDARGWVVGLALVGVLAVLITIVFGDHARALATRSITFVPASIVLCLVSASVIAWAYGAHLSGLRSSVRTAVLLVIAAAVLVAPREGFADPLDGRELVADSTMTIHTDRVVAQLDGASVAVDVPVTYPDSSVVVAAAVAWQLQLRDGGVVQLIRPDAQIRRGTRPLTPQESFDSWGRGPMTRVLKFRYPLDSATQARLAGNLESVSLSLQMDRLVMRRLAAFPVAAGGTVAHSGARMKVAGSPDGVRFATVSSVVWAPADPRHTADAFRFAAGLVFGLVPERGGPAVALRRVSGDAAKRLRTPSWVTSFHRSMALSPVLMPTDTTKAQGRVVAAFGGEYAGRVSVPVRATVPAPAAPADPRVTGTARTTLGIP